MKALKCRYHKAIRATRYIMDVLLCCLLFLSFISISKIEIFWNVVLFSRKFFADDIHFEFDHTACPSKFFQMQERRRVYER